MPQDDQATKRAFIYARTSAASEDEEVTLSIEEQLAACRSLCQSQGYQIIGEFVDVGRSGRTYPTGSPFINLNPVFEQDFQEQTEGIACREKECQKKACYCATVVYTIKRRLDWRMS